MVEKVPKLGMTPNAKKAAKVIGVIALFVVGFFIVAFYMGWLGSIFQPPAPPPEEFARGWAKIHAYDPINEVDVSGNVFVFYFTNETNWLNTTTDVSFYLENASFCIIDCGADYYNTTLTIFGSGSDDPNSVRTTVAYVERKAANNDVKMYITKIDSIPGSYKATDITNGHHTLTILITITGSSRGTCVFGAFCYIPQTWRNETYAFQNGLPGEGGWIGWNGTVENMQYWGRSEDVYNVSSIMASTSWAIEYDLEIEIEATFNNVKSIILYYGFLDDWQNYIEIL